MSTSRKKRPAIGDYVVLRWLDSGMDHNEAPKGALASLHISESMGRVVRIGVCEQLKGDLPKGWSAERIVLAHCSAGEDDEGSHLGSVWWPSVVEWRAVE